MCGTHIPLPRRIVRGVQLRADSQRAKGKVVTCDRFRALLDDRPLAATAPDTMESPKKATRESGQVFAVTLTKVR